MRKLIRHKWKPLDGFRNYKCERCGCLKYWSEGWKRLVYERRGMFMLQTPSCYLPNTKIN